MKKSVIFTSLCFLLFHAYGLMLAGAELFINVKIIKFKSDSLICKFFDSKTGYHMINNHELLERSPEIKITKIASIREKIDTTWFDAAKDSFKINYFNRQDKIVVFFDGGNIVLPKMISSSALRYVNINIYTKDVFNIDTCKNIAISLLTITDAIKPKSNFVIKNQHRKFLKNCNKVKVNSIFEVQNVFIGGV